MEAYGQVKGRKYPDSHNFDYKRTNPENVVSKETKVCTDCGNEIPLTDYYLIGGVRKQPCKKCWIKRNKRYKENKK